MNQMNTWVEGFYAIRWRKGSVAQRLSSASGGSPTLITGSLSMMASGLHTKYHWPPVRSSDLLGGAMLEFRWFLRQHVYDVLGGNEAIVDMVIVFPGHRCWE
jgi:hypothetical protein